MELIKRHHRKYHTSPPITVDKRAHEQERCHFCQLKSFSTWLDYPISIKNDFDDSTIPNNFKFIENSILCAGVEAAEEDFRTGCDCVNDEQCEMQQCSCLQDMDLGSPRPNIMKKVFAYNPSGYYQGCLRKEILQSRQPIYECQDSCSCSLDCKNGVVEAGRKVPLEIFRTSDGRGWGVRSSVDIKEGQYVDKYVGEIITAEEADQRREDSEVAQRKDVYLFALDKFSDPESMDPRLAGPPLEVDGEFKSGPTRFINHSCDPNLRSFARVGDHADKHLHDLALFAIRKIPAGEELTFDYVDGLDTSNIEDNLKDPEKRKDMERCLCGSEDCRGFLW